MLTLDNIGIREIISAFYGRCYTVEGHIPSDDTLVLDLNASMKYKVFVHNEGEEIWIAGGGYSPIEVIVHTLGKPPALSCFQLATNLMSNNFAKCQLVVQK